MAEVTVSAAPDHEILELLEEWYAYWRDEAHMPHKMPNSLHVRTAVALTMRGRHT